MLRRKAVHISGRVAIAAVVSLAACSDSGSGTPSDRGPVDGEPPGVTTAAGDGDGQSDSGETGGSTGTARSRLVPLGDRLVFFTELRGAMAARHGGGNDDVFAADTADAVAAAPALVAEGDAGTGGGSGRLEVTETNVQERGVDEQDLVKVTSDGTRLFVLQESVDDGVYPAEPVIVEDIETGEPISIETGDMGDAALGGYRPQRHRVSLRILGLDADATEATALRDVEIDLGGRHAQGMYLYEGETARRILLTSTGNVGYGHWNDGVAFGGSDSVIVRLDVDEADSAAISGSIRIDGQIVSSRRIGKHLFLASRFYPTLGGPSPWELSEAAWAAAVDAADESTLLPGYTLASGGERRPLFAPENCFVAPRPANDRWYAPDIVTLAVIDIETMELTDSACYLGASETLYASPDAVYLATTRWDHGGFADGGIADGGLIAEPAIVTDGEAGGGGEEVTDGMDDRDDAIEFAPGGSSVQTDIHQFDIDGGTLAYRGSGTVPGHLGFDPLRKPFRMSARDGDLRVASVNDGLGFVRQGSERSISPISLTVLRPDGDGDLERIAELPNADRPEVIGKPGEQLYASRFIGDRAYLVTFRQTDPLYVIDLADPADPAILGELEIEGYSDYLLPVDENHLLGIGRDAVPAPGGDGDERGAFVLGVKLSLFDVSEPDAPREVDSLVVGQRGTQAAALFDHRGITVQRATGEHPLRVSFGIEVAGNAFPDGRPDPTVGLPWYDWTYSGLHGFDVRVGDDAGIASRGAMVVERRGQDDRYYGGGGYEDRAVMVNDATYYVHRGAVRAAPWDDLANPGPAR